MLVPGIALYSPFVALPSPLVLQCLCYAVMLGAGLVMILAHRHNKYHGTTGARVVAVVCGVLVVGAVLARLFLPRLAQENVAVRLVAQEKTMQERAYQKFGATLATPQSGGRIVILHPAVDAESAAAAPLNANLAALRAGLSQGGRAIAVQAFRRAAGTRAHAVLNADEFDAAVDSITGDCTLLVVLGGLPHDYTKTTFHRRQETSAEDARVRVAVTDTNLYPLAKLIQDQFIVGALSPNPKFDPRTPPTGTPEEVLAQRFLIITPANVGAVARDYPGLLHPLE